MHPQSAAGELAEKRLVSSALQKLLQRETARNEAAQVLSPEKSKLSNRWRLGLRNMEIGKKLFISEGIFKHHEKILLIVMSDRLARMQRANGRAVAFGHSTANSP